ncbi:FkbM family methyltransferase [Thalassobius vesicularis]|uniref:FkbM family methyltransferase n=1 Tax=Thalassobius vesicularis TaxID=1294297 RepID=A0A4S3MDB8_9RHOB|nr:FkbM family methyltransferase [Thalassobius vesicularis]THD76823.1 FkbM family methyltransferase [Thalassobius vesicularis]
MDKFPEILASNEYGRYSVPEGLEHRPAVRLVTDGQVYEPETIRFMREHAGDGDIIHAGTFFGDFLPGLSAAIAPDARIWAFEPNPNSYAHATRTIALNGLENVVLTHAAVSNSDAPIRFRTRDAQGNPLGGHSRYVTEDGPGVETVPAIQLDTVIPDDRRISILQLDVEGHERAALDGALRLIARCQPILILEEFRHKRWIKARLGHLGYELKRKLHANRVFAPADRVL